MDIKLLCVIDKQTKCQIDDVSKFVIKQVVSESSNTKKPVWRFFLDDKIIRKNNDYQVTYQCPSCSRPNIVCLNNITRKINRGILKCNTCKNQEGTKIKAHVNFMNENAGMIRASTYIKPENISQKVSLQEKLKLDAKLFDEQDDDFKDLYFRKHLTYDEFERIKSKIVSFHNDKFCTQDFEYYPCVSVPNQAKFAPYVYDKKRDVLEKMIYIKYNCEKCGCHFTNRDLHIQKNKLKILCQECNFCNNTFKIRTARNCIGELITYQSKFELKFIEFCNKNNLKVNNGPVVSYNFNGKEHKYKVDFIIKDIMVEIKDNHHWHQQQIQSGKWEKKESAALEYAKSNGLKYKIVYPKNYIDFCKNILNNKA